MSESDPNVTRKLSALQYQEAGFSVIPIRVKDKRPSGEWKDYQSRLATREEIEGWWAENADLNFAVVTGKVSKLIVVDIDPKNGGEESVKQLHLPPTHIIRTGGGGAHYYYQWLHDAPPPNRKGYLSGIDIQGEGAYVVAPPSTHKSGNDYEALTPLSEISEAPPWLFELDHVPEERKWVKGIEGAAEGERNETAASICGKALSSLPPKLWEVLGWGGLKEWNSKNTPPLPENELRAVYESIRERASQNEDESDDENKSVARRIVDIILQRNPSFFHDRVEATYARIAVEEHDELHALNSSRFKSWVVRQYWLEEKKPPKGEHIRTALDVLHSMALFEGEKIDLATRVGKKDAALWYDLSDENWRAIKITDQGWEVVERPPALFRRYKHMSPQCSPKKGGSVDLLLRYVNITSPDHQLLMLVYIVSCFVPDIPHPIPILYGSQGSAKSTFLRVLRRLIDPSATELLTFPTHKEQLIQLLSHHYAPYFDNATTLPDWLSDSLCRAVTGEGFSKRELYTNDDDIIYFFRSCIGLNGINVAATKADLLDRSILFGLERIPPEKRQDEDKFWKTFEQERPVILGGVFDALSKALGIIPEVKVGGLPRMADFALWGCAIAVALGYTQEQFLTAYQANIDEQNEEAIREHPVAVAVRAYMKDKQDWSGTSTQLLDVLNKIAGEEKIDVRQRLWPKAAQALSRRVNEAKTNLAHVGILINTTHGSNRVISIHRNTVDTDGHGDFDANDSTDANSEADAQATLDLIRENLDPNAHFIP